MPFIPVPDCGLVRLRLICDTLEAHVGSWWRNPGYTVEDASDLLETLWAGWVVDLMAILAPEVTATRLDFTGMRSQEDVYAFYAAELVGSSGVGEHAAAWGNAAVITFRTAKRGRWNHGRCYIPGIPEESSDVNGIETGTGLALIDAFDDHFPSQQVNDWYHVVVSQFFDNAPREEAVAEVVTGYAITSLKWGFQRRRMRR